ncbi:MAG: hypothetical protein K8R92_02415 [Planctomycetes bacterium]|nr:hypothetical protein [Planctomycetota bacterium]
MGQATLAFRNFLIRAAIFVVLAALLAWAVGGTLFGKHRVNFPPVAFDGRDWAAQAIGNGQRPDEVRWRLLSKAGDDPWTVNPDSESGVWRELVGPMVDAQGLTIAVTEDAPGPTIKQSWTLIRFANAKDAPTKSPLPSGAPLRSVP